MAAARWTPCSPAIRAWPRSTRPATREFRADPRAMAALPVRDAPAGHALRTRFEGSGMQHAVEPAVPNWPITLDIRDVPFNTALRTLLRLAPGVAYRKEGDIYIVGMKQQPVEQTTASQEIQPPEEANATPEYQYEKLPLNFSSFQVMAYVLSGQQVPTEVDIQGGGGGGGYG